MNLSLNEVTKLGIVFLKAVMLIRYLIIFNTYLRFLYSSFPTQN